MKPLYQDLDPSILFPIEIGTLSLRIHKRMESYWEIYDVSKGEGIYAGLFSISEFPNGFLPDTHNVAIYLEEAYVGKGIASKVLPLIIKECPFNAFSAKSTSHGEALLQKCGFYLAEVNQYGSKIWAYKKD